MAHPVCPCSFLCFQEPLEQRKRMGEKKDNFKRKESFPDFCCVGFGGDFFPLPFVFFPAFCGENDYLERKGKRHNQKQIAPKTNSAGAEAAQRPGTDTSVLLHPGLVALPPNIPWTLGNRAAPAAPGTENKTRTVPLGAPRRAVSRQHPKLKLISKTMGVLPKFSWFWRRFGRDRAAMLALADSAPAQLPCPAAN